MTSASTLSPPSNGAAILSSCQFSRPRRVRTRSGLEEERSTDSEGSEVRLKRRRVDADSFP